MYFALAKQASERNIELDVSFCKNFHDGLAHARNRVRKCIQEIRNFPRLMPAIIGIIFTICAGGRLFVRFREFLRCPMRTHLVTRVNYYSRTRVAVSTIISIIRFHSYPLSFPSLPANRYAALWTHVQLPEHKRDL